MLERDAQLHAERLVLSHECDLSLLCISSVMKLKYLQVQRRHTHGKLAPVSRVGHRATGCSVVHGGRPHSIGRPHESGRAHLVSVAHVDSGIGRSGHDGQAAEDCLERRHVECERIKDGEGKGSTLAMVAPRSAGGLNIPTALLSFPSPMQHSRFFASVLSQFGTRISQCMQSHRHDSRTGPSRRLPLPPSPLSRAPKN